MATERLSDFIVPDDAVARSINLERDLSDNATLKRYILTDKGRAIIHRLAEGLNGERVSAWSLTGPYGMGKSAFVRYLLALCGPFQDKVTKRAQKMLARRDQDLLDRFLQSLLKRQSKTSGLFRVPVTAAFEPINRTLAEGLRRAVQETDGPKGADGDRRRLLAAIDEVLKRDHRYAAACLPELCIRFAQNDRTLFAFLCGGEPNALPAFLNQQAIESNGGDLPTFGPARLYDYFIASAGGAAMGRPVSSRWIEIQNMIDRAVGLPEADQDLLKIIGLLNLVAGVRASTGVVAYAVDGPGTAAGETAEALARLSGKGLLLYREYADEYRLWEGTDVDIRAEIAKEREQIGRQPIENLLENAFPLGAVIAARHSYETGTLRRFERRWAGPEALAGQKSPAIPDSVDGLILYGFVKSGDARTLPPAHAEDGRPVLTGTADREEQVRDLALEAAVAELMGRYPDEGELKGILAA